MSCGATNLALTSGTNLARSALVATFATVLAVILGVHTFAVADLLTSEA